MWHAAVVGPWAGTGSRSDPYRPLLRVAYPAAQVQDVTGQPVANLRPSPNTVTVEVRVEDATLEAIEADARFLVLWSEEA